MYDLSVTENHEYFADGILVHNCRYMLNAANYDTVEQKKFVESSRRSYTYYDDIQESQDEYESLIGDLYEN